MPKYLTFQLMLLSLLVPACSQNNNQNNSVNLDPPDVVIKTTANIQQWIINNQAIDPQDPQHPVAGAWLSVGSFANHQCFDYQSTAQQLDTSAQLGISFTNLEFAKSFGVTTSLKVGLLGVGHSFKLLNTYMSSEIGKYNLNITYKLTMGGRIQNSYSGLNAQGKLYAKNGVESLVINCGSHFVNSYHGTLGGLMIFTLSGTNLNSLQVIENTLETTPVSFIGILNLIKPLQQQSSNGISYSTKFVPYGGTVTDQAALTNLVTSLANSANLQTCLKNLDTTASGNCNQFIQNDVESSFLSGVATIFESEIAANNFSGLVVDDYSQRTITSLYGRQVGFNKIDALPDPYANFPIESQILAAYDLTLASQLESNQVAIVKNLYANSTDIDLKNVVTNMTSNTNTYADYANFIWQQLQRCVNSYSCSSSIPNPATMLQNNPVALNNLYYLAYNVEQKFMLLNTSPSQQLSIPGFLYSDGKDSLVIAKQMASSQIMQQFTSPLYRIINESAISKLNSDLRYSHTINSEVNFGISYPFNGFIMSIYNYNFDNNQKVALNCSLANINSSCTASIMTNYTNNSILANGGLFISTENPFYSLPNPN